jgi:hypothetical protein
MHQNAPFRRNVALNAAGIVAWCLFLVIYLILPASLADPPVTGRMVATWTLLFAIVGLPVSLLLSFSIGGWALDRSLKAGQRQWIDGLKAGALVGAIFGTVGTKQDLLRSCPFGRGGRGNDGSATGRFWLWRDHSIHRRSNAWGSC